MLLDFANSSMRTPALINAMVEVHVLMGIVIVTMVILGTIANIAQLKLTLQKKNRMNVQLILLAYLKINLVLIISVSVIINTLGLIVRKPMKMSVFVTNFKCLQMGYAYVKKTNMEMIVLVQLTVVLKERFALKGIAFVIPVILVTTVLALKNAMNFKPA